MTQLRSRRRRRALLARALSSLTLLALLVSAPAAWAHAQLLGSSPASGSTVQVQPRRVSFQFNQAVGGTVGAVRVYDAQGHEVDDLDVSHPGGREQSLGVGLKPGLPDGTYTATYRVVSADTHIVYGGMVFNIGHAGAAPKFTVAGLIDQGKSGTATKLAFGVVRSLDYLSIALMIGGLAFTFWAWLPGLAAVAGGEPQWSSASQAYAKRVYRLLLVAIAIGVTVSVLGILLQGASAAGVSLWASLKDSIIDDTLSSRFGRVWGLRALVWVAIGAVLIGARALRRQPLPQLRPAALGADGLAVDAGAPRAILVLLGACCLYLAATPALAGHASVESPVVLFFPSELVHVLSASVWVGGIACLLLAVPQATRQLHGGDRSRLLLATLTRFSPVALAAVLAIAVTGVVQAYIDVRSLHALLHSTYGALVIVKVLLLLGLISLGWVNRERVIPALKRLAGACESPGATGVLARRTMRLVFATMICVFGVTAALVSYAPPIDAATGPFSIDTTIGPAELEMTVDPARVGLNTIHLYLINAKDGSQFTATKSLQVTAALPAKAIGPLPLKSYPSGPGHYALNSAELSPDGTWSIQITDRVSQFDEYTKTIEVPIR